MSGRKQILAVMDAMETDEAAEHAEHTEPIEQQWETSPLMLDLSDHMLEMLDH